MLIHKIDKRKKYIDIQENCHLYGIKDAINTQGFRPYHGMIEEYNELPSWSVIQIETINSKLIRAMYAGNV